MNKRALQQQCASSLQGLLPWLRYYLRDLLRQAPADTLSLHEIRLLGRVRRFPGLSLQALADDLGISKATASGRVDQLVGQGLLERRVNPESRREIQLEISDTGLQAYRRAKDYLKSHLVAQMDELSPDDLLALEKGLAVLGEIVSRARPEIGPRLKEL